MSNKSIEVKGFKHHRQPYGLHVIDGVWTPYTLDRIAEIEAWYDENITYNCERSKRDAVNRHKHLVEQGYGDLIGTITKGYTRNRLFHITSDVDDTGKSTTVMCKEKDIIKGELVSVAM